MLVILAVLHMQISTFATLLESIFEINYIQIHHTHTQDNIALSVTFIKLCRRTRSFLKKFWHCARKDRMKRMNSNFVPQTDATTFVFASLSILLLLCLDCLYSNSLFLLQNDTRWLRIKFASIGLLSHIHYTCTKCIKHTVCGNIKYSVASSFYTDF